MAQRTFFTVGNGLFVMEETDGIRSVYDCGGQNQTLIDYAVFRAANHKHGHLDNVFISHFHKDHVNGLMTLLSIYDVDRIILPMVPNLTRVLNFSATTGNYHYGEFILDPQGFIQQVSPNTRIVEINSNVNNEQNPEGISLEDITANVTLNNRISLCRQNSWLYVIFNRRVLTDIELGAFMTKLGLTINATNDEIIDALKQTGKNTLLQSLKSVFNGQELKLLNDYSMTVWSGKADDLSDGSLFTGDYNAKDHYPELNAVYGQYMPTTKILQIPHHGSIDNFHIRLCQQQATHVISASAGPYKSRQIVDPNDVINQLNANNFQEQDTRNGDVTL